MSFEVCNAVLLAIIAMLCIRSLEVIHLVTGSLYPLTNISALPLPPAGGNHLSKSALPHLTSSSSFPPPPHSFFVLQNKLIVFLFVGLLSFVYLILQRSKLHVPKLMFLFRSFIYYWFKHSLMNCLLGTWVGAGNFNLEATRETQEEVELNCEVMPPYLQ